MNIIDKGKNYPNFICLSGIDGAGKTTLAKAFIKFARENGVKYKYVWANNKPIIMAPLRVLWRRIYFKEKNMFSDYDDYNRTKKDLANKSQVMYALYCFIHTIDYLFWLMIRVKLPIMLKKRIICDRYVYDVALNLSVLSSFNFDKTTQLINKYLKFSPIPDVLFMIDVPEKTAIGRKKDIPSLSYLKERRVIYKQLAEFYNMTLLDGTIEVNELCRRVWSSINI